jgi:hypothetical protein
MNIKPLRDFNESEKLPFFSYNGATANKGTFVVAVGSGLNLDEELSLNNLSYLAGTMSAEFNVPWLVTAATSGAAKGQVLGMLIKDVRTVDENGYPLIFEPRKAAEMDVIVSGQAGPIAKRGFVLYSGIAGTPAAGSGASISDTVPGELKVVAPGAGTVGRFLGPKNAAGYAPLDFDVI